MSKLSCRCLRKNLYSCSRKLSDYLTFSRVWISDCCLFFQFAVCKAWHASAGRVSPAALGFSPGVNLSPYVCTERTKSSGFSDWGARARLHTRSSAVWGLVSGWRLQMDWQAAVGQTKDASFIFEREPTETLGLFLREDPVLMTRKNK